MYELEWYRVSFALRLYIRDVGHFLIYNVFNVVILAQALRQLSPLYYYIQLIAIYIQKHYINHLLFRKRGIFYYDGRNKV